MGTSDSKDQIELDLGRTFTTHLTYTDKIGKGQKELGELLNAYARYDAEVGYCQGMNFIGAVILMNLPLNQAFHVFISVMQHLRTYFVPSMWELKEDANILESMMKIKFPLVIQKLKKLKIELIMFLSKWFMCCFTFLPWPCVLRIFDLLLIEGKKKKKDYLKGEK